MDINRKALSDLEKCLLDNFQSGLPLTSDPYGEIADTFGVSREDVLAALSDMKDSGVLSRVGVIAAPHKMGWSTLAAMEVPPGRLDEVAALINGYDEVNHNYEREHDCNLWFVITAADEDAVADVLDEIAERTNLAVLNLPLEEAYHINLGFPLQWN